MLLHTECFNPYHTNCYFLTDEEKRQHGNH